MSQNSDIKMQKMCVYTFCTSKMHIMSDWCFCTCVIFNFPFVPLAINSQSSNNVDNVLFILFSKRIRKCWVHPILVRPQDDCEFHQLAVAGTIMFLHLCCIWVKRRLSPSSSHQSVSFCCYGLPEPVYMIQNVRCGRLTNYDRLILLHCPRFLIDFTGQMQIFRRNNTTQKLAQMTSLVH